MFDMDRGSALKYENDARTDQKLMTCAVYDIKVYDRILNAQQRHVRHSFFLLLGKIAQSLTIFGLQQLCTTEAPSIIDPNAEAAKVKYLVHVIPAGIL